MVKTIKRKSTKVVKTQCAISEDTIRRKAEQIWLRTGNQNANENWFAARQALGLQ